MSARLSPSYRSAAVSALAGEFDVLVVGGGVVGAGAALDAAARGLSVALVEAEDWAAGTSSRSSKLIHGGLRYLEQRDFALVREALRERSLLLHRLAPHLVRPVPFLFPLRHGGWERAYVGAGVALYDSIGGARALPMHRHLSRRKALTLAPALRPDALTGAVRYYDAQVDDARLTMMIARTAAQHGATVLTRARVTGLLTAGRDVIGARVVDLLSGTEHSVRARRVIGAAGVWTGELCALAPAPAPFEIRMSKGVHFLVPREKIRLDIGLITRTEKSVLFVIPWSRYWIVGTTDTPWESDRSRPAATTADIDYLLKHVNAELRTPLSAGDIVGVYAGLRPLLAGRSSETTKLSREHTVAEPTPGFFVVAGGKYTTYRVMAADVVDAATRGLGRAVAPSLTRHLPIHGAVGYRELCATRFAVAARAGLPPATVERLLGRYGSAVTELLTMIETDRSLADPLPGAPNYLAAEAVYAVTHEGALDLEDILARRTRIAIEYPDRGMAAAHPVAGLIAPHLDWDAGETQAAVAGYRATARADLAAHSPTTALTPS
ncbi:MAG TPA: glycerol-3-phosphate dehydrogenase/oxidase [Actinophytocola sp.]|uniref:glycerol-3-phosphate dehydrogenase/oxidase n=1 Tax=Actinophytocola sp. TaxID=1872138 RepID=UPI002DBDCC8D|nr:glycerol-3-phosphate dehydrogenase/oxidase [Actinophytocola sp.]HEU5472601.1 glycerol-3-phosphate dehydrogenase/oxidase [Actinophytocola sp.]